MKLLMLFPIILAAATPIRAEEARLTVQLGHSETVNSVAFSPDGRLALSGSQDNTARLWDVSTGRELRRFESTLPVTRVVFFPDGQRVITAGGESFARLWDVSTGREIRRFEGHSSSIASVALSPDGRLLLTGSLDSTARLWDVATGHEVRRFQGHAFAVESVAFSPNGRLVLTGGLDGEARLWNATTGRELRRLVLRSKSVSNSVTCVAFSPDGRLLLTGDNSTVRLWDAVTGRQSRRFDGHRSVSSAAFSPIGGLLVSGDYGGIARVWSIRTGKVKRTLQPALAVRSAIRSVAFSPDGEFILTAGEDKTPRLWGATNGQELRKFEGLLSHVTAIAFSPDKRSAVMVGEDAVARLWDLAAGRQVRQFDVGRHVFSAAFSPDGTLLLTGHYAGDVGVWDVSNGERTRSFFHESHFSVAAERVPIYSVHAVAFSPDGRSALSGSDDGTARVWDIRTGQEVRRFDSQVAVTAVALSPDGRYVLTGHGDGSARLWDIATSQQRRRFVASPNRLMSVGFSPDGSLIVTSDRENTQLWDLTNGHEIRRFDKAGGQAAFTPDGRFVLTGDDSRPMRLWSASTGRELQRFEEYPTSIAISPDGGFVLAGTADRTLRLWRLTSGALVTTIVSFGTDFGDDSLNGHGEWAVVTPAGHYDGSNPSNSTNLHFVVGNEVIELGQLKQRFHAPGVLGRLWRGESPAEINESLKDVGLVPAIEVDAPLEGSTLATVRLTDRGGGIGRVFVKVNGREIPDMPRREVADSTVSAVQIRADLSNATLLATGNNVIEVSADTGDDLIRSRGVSVVWRRQPEKSEPQRFFAVVAGVATFDNTELNLRYPAKDAIEIGNALRLGAEGLFGRDRTQVTILASGIGLEPTKANIRKAFEDIARQARAHDVLAVYLAGHGSAGSSERDQYYYLTRDARSSIDDILRDSRLRDMSTISSAELKDWLSRKNMPLKQVIMLDTCAAGAAFTEMLKLADRRELSPDQIRAFELLKDATGSWILMGSAADAVSYEATRYAQGLLTYSLLFGMQGAALDGESIEVSKLFGFAQRYVLDLARGIGGIQRPVLSAPKGQTFPIGLLSERDRKRIRLATVKPQLLRARVLDKATFVDPLGLEPALRSVFRSASLPWTRNGEPVEPPIVYLDAVVDEVPGALTPQVLYSVDGDTIRFELRLLAEGKPVWERSIERQRTATVELGQMLLREFVEESVKLIGRSLR